MISTLLLHALGLLLAPSFAFASFSDVTSEHPNVDAINYVQEQGIVSGYPDGTFRPDAQINRAEFVKIIIGALWADDPSFVDNCLQDAPAAKEMYAAPGFLDVDYQAWYGKYLCVARRSDIIDGYPDGTFRPAASINFVEAAKILVNGFGIARDPGHDPDNPSTPWYRAYVKDMEAKNALPVSILSPDQYLTRGEMAEMVYRLKENITDKPSQTYDLLTSQNRMTLLHQGKPIPVSFAAPAAWGTLGTYDSSDTSETFMFTLLSAQTIYPNHAQGNVWVTIKPADGTAWKPSCLDGWCHPTTNGFVPDGSVTKNGMTIQWIDSYSPPGGSVGRTYRISTSQYTVLLHSYYSVVTSFYDEQYRQAQEAGQSPSITELVRKDLGEEAEDPINRLIALYPEKAGEMAAFFASLEAMAYSVDTEN